MHTKKPIDLKDVKRFIKSLYTLEDEIKELSQMVEKLKFQQFYNFSFKIATERFEDADIGMRMSRKEIAEDYPAGFEPFTLPEKGNFKTTLTGSESLLLLNTLIKGKMNYCQTLKQYLIELGILK